ncbi:MAG: DUF2085 domain-containing protein [Candidatus Aegiribacteria sp.]
MKRFSGGRLVLALMLGVPSFLLFALSMAGPLTGKACGFLDPALSAVCHRLPSRSVLLPWGYSALCARCTAFWLGAAAGTVLMYRPAIRVPFWAGIPALLPLAVDGLLQYHNIYQSGNLLRMLTGLAAGLGITVLFFGNVPFRCRG